MIWLTTYIAVIINRGQKKAENPSSDNLPLLPFFSSIRPYVDWM